MEKERLTEELGSTTVSEAAEISKETVTEETPNQEITATNGQTSTPDTEASEPSENTVDQVESRASNEIVDNDNASEDITSKNSDESEEESDASETVSTPEAPSAQTEATETTESENPTKETTTETIEGSKKESDIDEEIVSDTDANKEPESQPSSNDEHEPEEDLAKEVDFTKLSRDEILAEVKSLAQADNIEVKNIDRVLTGAKPAFKELENVQREEAKKAFIEDGGEEDNFEYHADEIAQRFYANCQLLRDKKQQYYKNLEKQKETNLQKKNDILEELRHLVDGEETVTSIKVIKEIQEKWKSIGPIPRQHNRTLWANYNALMDRFYDNRSIYFELKDLDRKKNLELKEELCAAAEGLAAEDNLQKAIKELNHLHEEFKHIGPVPQENNEELWIRFKAASDEIYSRRKDHVEEIKEELGQNYEVKLELVGKLKELLEFTSDRITEWNAKTKEVLEIQKKWEATGGVPREKSKINKEFWSSFKGFFANKNKFFKSLEGQRDENLRKKEELVEKAEELKDSEDINKTTEEYKRIQRQWKDIGPVPEKNRKEIFKRFKAACDYFFDRKREAVKESEKEFYENFEKKMNICDQIEEMIETNKVDLDIIETLQTQYAQIGFVPRSELKKMNKRYDEIMNKLVTGIEESDLDNKEQIAFKVQVHQAKANPGSNKAIQKKEGNLKKQISTIENDIATWENNMEFFRDSKTADKFKKEFETKIDAASKELKQLKKQLRLIDQV
ncbi:MAG: DUF349 domain-containing protein [Cyclobacteriaceae bacterium]